MIINSRACQMKMSTLHNFFSSDALISAAGADTLRSADANLAQAVMT